VDLDEAIAGRRQHRREPGSIRCEVCHERHLCAEWRRARAVVLVLVRRAFAAARAGDAL
jgi:hypothetical protein